MRQQDVVSDFDFAALTFVTLFGSLLSAQAQIEAQKATQEFQRSVEILRAAKETIALAEERLLEEDSRQFDSAWQEMLNHATQRVNAPRRPLRSPGGGVLKNGESGSVNVGSLL